jgi:hypothetical protein
MLSTRGDEEGAIVGLIVLLFELVFFTAFMVIWIASWWKINVKAGQPGWVCLVPVYGPYILVNNILKKPIWWLVLMLIPCTAGIWTWVVNIELAKRFGKGAGFGIGLTLLPLIFLPMLAFGSAQYDNSPGEAGGVPGGMPGMNPYGGAPAPAGYGAPPPGGYGGPQGGMPPGGGYGGPPPGGGYGGPPGGMPPGGGYGGPPGGMPPGGGYGGPPGGGYPPR